MNIMVRLFKVNGTDTMILAAAKIIGKCEASFSRLPPAHQKLLEYLPSKFEKQKELVKVIVLTSLQDRRALEFLI
jgi:hypothetical protein